MTYYFAYGSNMDTSQMKRRCPDSKLIGTAILKNYRLGFTIFSPKRMCGCADIIKSSGSKVYGLLYALTLEDLKKLDAFENSPYKYRRFTAKVARESGKGIKAETYEVVKKEKEFQKPSKDYLNKLILPARNFRFPKYYQKLLGDIEVRD